MNTVTYNSSQENETLDGYDKQIAYLSAHPDRIHNHWGNSIDLFEFAMGIDNFCKQGAGCLTMIRRWNEHYVIDNNGRRDEELTEIIRNDSSIPVCTNDITIKSLPVFAKYQRIIDKKYNRPPFIFNI